MQGSDSLAFVSVRLKYFNILNKHVLSHTMFQTWRKSVPGSGLGKRAWQNRGIASLMPRLWSVSSTEKRFSSPWTIYARSSLVFTGGLQVDPTFPLAACSALAATASEPPLSSRSGGRGAGRGTKTPPTIFLNLPIPLEIFFLIDAISANPITSPAACEL